MQEMDIRQERKYCSRLGWSLVLTLVCALVWQVFLMAVALAGRLNSGLTLYYLLTLVGHYIIALPLAYRLCRNIPAPAPVKRGMTARRMARWFVIGIALMWFGSLIGSTLNALVYRVAGLEPVDMVTETFDMLPLSVVLLGACILGPVCEELLFRGLLAGRLARYGQKPAALVSALLFGLYHANLSQFFYAFALGLLLTYVYFYTGSLKAPILLHMLFNFYGSAVVLMLPESGILPVLYMLSWPVLTIAGVILLMRGRKRQVWEHGPCAPSIQTIFCNIGMTAAVVVLFVETALLFL
ncbi:MAG TPA: CPBP family intramembrane metalloprotease [Candidatus Agathobaculum merdigallinarum]|nr:CPBP family intramembrane metalloprotease [Candidatus Agathobaculum merdigallinarum]